MIRFSLLNNIENGRQEELNGEMYTVYPVVMLTEGVHSGSGGPTLYTSEELQNFTATWNGVPVTVQHPELNGMPVSANDPEIFENQVVGTIFNTHFENGKLKAEAWLRNASVERIVPGIHNTITNGGRLEVSTGLFNEEETSEGVFNGEEYASIAHNIRPDHLALLPDGVGACSWADGCGIRANKEGGKSGMIKKKKVKTNSDKKWDEFFVNSNPEEFTANEMDYTQVVRTMREKIDSMDIQGEKINFLERMYPTYAIYRVRYRDGNRPKFFKRNYNITNEGIEWTSDPVEVRMMDEPFVEIQNNSRIIKKKQTTNKEETMAKTMKECCPDKVDELIKNNENFTEEDKDVLLGMTEDAFAFTINKAKPIKKEDKEDKVQITTFEELYANASPEIKESVDYGKKLVENKKNELIETIKANESNKFSDEELNAYSIDMLEKLASMSPVKKNFAANVGGITETETEEVAGIPITNSWDKEEK